jgi:hypothetical protein
MRILATLLALFSLSINADYWSENPKQIISSEDKSQFIISDSIFLSCESSPKQSVKDLLENNIKLELNRKQKRAIKKGFDNDVKSKKNKQEMLDGKSQLPIQYVYLYNFAAIKISKFSNSENKVEFCSSWNKNLNELKNCKYFEKTNNTFEYSYTSGVLDGSIFSTKTINKILNRETLKYNDLEETNSTYGGQRYNNYKFQCHLSDQEEINILHKNFINLLTPLQKEWDKHIDELVEQDNEIRDKNKI